MAVYDGIFRRKKRRCDRRQSGRVAGGVQFVQLIAGDTMEKGRCFICKKEISEADLISGHGIRHELEQLIVKEHPGWNDAEVICKDDLNGYRDRYIATLIEEENGSILELEKDVVNSIRQNDILVENVNNLQKDAAGFSETVADKVASFGGSWKFIILFFIILCGWIIMNSIVAIMKPFDPYPFILMNLVLSCIAAIQAPIIMMSQNRQEKKDRLRAENDFKVNLKSEIEIRTLHEKVDHLLLDQWSKMMTIQNMQLELLEEIRNRVR